MDTIKAARELGKAIQADERYIAYVEAKKSNDEDKALQDLIGEFNLKRQNMQLEMSKKDDEKDSEKLQSMNRELQNCYEKVMNNPNMANFAIVKSALDKLIHDVNGIIAMCCEGENPDTCEIQQCTSDCSSCGGCH